MYSYFLSLDIGTIFILSILFVCSVTIVALAFFKWHQLHMAVTLLKRIVTGAAQKTSGSNDVVSIFLDDVRFLATVSHHEALHRVDLLLDRFMSHYEQHLSVFSTIAAVAPLLGLLGTIWGLVNAFTAMGEVHSVDLATIAPGIAQALVTTLAGLMVAIPSLMLYHYLRLLGGQLEQLSYHCVDVLLYERKKTS